MISELKQFGSVSHKIYKPFHTISIPKTGSEALVTCQRTDPLQKILGAAEIRIVGMNNSKKLLFVPNLNDLPRNRIQRAHKILVKSHQFSSAPKETLQAKNIFDHVQGQPPVPSKMPQLGEQLSQKGGKWLEITDI